MKRTIEQDSRATQDQLDQLELRIAQSTTARELDATLDSLTSNPVLSLETLAVYQLAGPAKLLTLVLSGYELPDARARFVSATHVSKLLKLLAATSATAQLHEQVALILAAQQDVLLGQIEQDLEALHEAEEGSVVAKNQAILAKLHKQLRLTTGQVAGPASESISWQQLPAFGA